jgi:hypothetical protein
MQHIFGHYACKYTCGSRARHYAQLIVFTLLYRTLQAAYNNESQFDQNEHLDEESDSVLSGGDSGSRWPIGTKVLKQFGAEWFEGAILRYDGEDELYWILYDDGDSEDMELQEVEKAIADYKSHHPEESKDDTDSHCAAIATSLEQSACVAAASASLSEVTVTLASAVSNIALPNADVLAAIEAMTKAAEQLTSAAARIEVAVQQQHASDNDDSSAVQQTLLQQQQMFANHQQLLREQQSMQQQQQRWYMSAMLHQQQRYYWY